MTRKTLPQSATELLLSGKFTLRCTACGESNWVKAPPTNQTKKPGLLTVRCKTCANARSLACIKERYAVDEAFRKSESARSAAYIKERYATDEAWREFAKARTSANSKERYTTDEAFREASKAAGLQWAKDNPGKHKAKNAKRRSKKLQATPEWSDLQAIQAFYEACPEGCHVDHIVPLQGRNVSGLHVPTNLQYLTAYDNRSKGNKF